MSLLSYDTGTVTSLANLLTSIFSKATLQGWSSTGGGTKLTKGVMTMTFAAVGTGAEETLSLNMQVNGVDGPGRAFFLAGGFGGNAGTTLRDIVWPATYHIYVYDDPDLVVISLNHDAIYWQHAFFGMCDSLGSTGFGGGVPVYWSTFHYPIGGAVANLFNSPYVSALFVNNIVPFQFANADYVPNGISGYAYINEAAGFEASNTSPAVGWTPHLSTGVGVSVPLASINGDFPGGTFTVQRRQPNAWNGDAVFSEMRIAIQRPDGFWSWMFEVPHIRLCRNDYYADGQEVSKGSDVWKICPCRKKETDNRNASNYQLDGSGTYAFAMLKATA